MLLVDADSQGDLTTYAGWHNTGDIPITLATLMERSVRDLDINSKEAVGTIFKMYDTQIPRAIKVAAAYQDFAKWRKRAY